MLSTDSKVRLEQGPSGFQPKELRELFLSTSFYKINVEDPD